MHQQSLFIDGEWQAPKEGAVREIFNPANNEVLEKVGDASPTDAERAITAARRAFDDGPWPRMRAQERASFLLRLANQIETHAEELAILETRNNGKPLRESRADMADAAACFRYYAGLITKPLGQTYEVADPTITAMVVREPIGVCGQIIPWNYPLLMAAWKLAPALAAGNCCILKPAESTPLTALRLFELIAETGFPPGSAQLLPGPGPTVGHSLASSPLVDKIAFTGGTATGRKIAEAALGNLKTVTLELGGKSPVIVFADSDPEPTLEYVLFAIFAGQGEVCNAGSRLLLERSIADSFLPRLAAAAPTIRLGDGLHAETEMGPLISRSHLDRVSGYVQSGVLEGAQVLCGGHKVTDSGLDRGNFYAPTILTGVNRNMRVVQEEIFGPVLTVQLFEGEDEAVKMANDTIYGLAGGVFTRDLAKGMRVLKRLRAGITWLNTFHLAFNEAPWGGYKQSGIGRELGTYGLEAYMEVKQINVNTQFQKLGWFKMGQ